MNEQSVRRHDKLNIFHQSTKEGHIAMMSNRSSSFNGLNSTDLDKRFLNKGYILGKLKAAKLDMTYDQGRTNLLMPLTSVIDNKYPINPIIGNFLYCKKCKQSKPPRTHHCRHCDRCILRMDHHCPWLGNCIGFENHKYFFLLLIYYLSFSLFIVIQLSRSLYREGNVIFFI